MVKPFHREEFSLDSVMGLIQQGTGHGHLRVGKHRMPAGLFLLEPAPHARTVRRPRRGGDVVGKVAEPLSQRHHAQARALSYPVEQGVKLRTERLTHGRRNRRKFLRELEKRMAEAKTATCSRKQGAHTLRGAV